LNIPYIQENCNNSDIVKILTQRLSKDFLAILLLRYPRLEKKDRKIICNFFKKHQEPFRKNTHFKYLIIFTFAGIFGLDLSLKVYRMLLVFKNCLKTKNREKNQSELSKKELRGEKKR